jgi:curli production assembly/transport component CsgG
LKKQAQEHRDIYGIMHRPGLRSGFSAEVGYTYGSYIGGYGNETDNSGLMLELEQSITSHLSVKLDYQLSSIGVVDYFSEPVNYGDLLVNFYLTPKLKLSPYASVGGGLAYTNSTALTKNQFFPTFTGEAGLDFRFSKHVGLRLGVNYRYLLQDGIDGVTLGRVHDQTWSILGGITVAP